MKWQDDITLEVALATGNRRRGLLQLCMYALHIAAGCSLYFKTIKVGTIKRYIAAVATFLALFGSSRTDFRYAAPGDQKFHPTLQAVYTELTRWETVPNRREPFSLAMIDAQAKKVKDTNAPFLSFDAAFLDWSEVGTFNGNRRAEWCQDSSHSNPEKPQINRFGDAMAFCPNDIEMRTPGGRRLVGAAILQLPVSAYFSCYVTWRTQKNGDNGQVKVWTRAQHSGGRSLIEPMYRILQRFVALRGASDTVTPLALYQTDHLKAPKVLLITDSKATVAMRWLAAKVYKLDPVKHKDELQRWSCHSFRVGACVLLHEQGFTGEQIKFLLRWRSDAFMTYLRNSTILADQQVRALDRSSGLVPNTI
jgi:hypothetical protein